MKKIYLLFFVSNILLTGFSFGQNLPNTLLWRISGNGLQKPSYLYGTIHLNDARVFNIGDSLYSAITNSEGFAIEIDPQYFTSFIVDEAKKEILKNEKLMDAIDEKDFEKYGDALSKKLNKNKNDITTNDIVNEKNKWIRESYAKGTMTTFLDIYLFDIARRQGKWTGGVEKIEDQKNLTEDLFDETDLNEIVSKENKKSGNAVTPQEQMIRDYINDDLNAVDSISNLSDSVYHDKLLTKRNKKMAAKMDSLSHERAMVFAVGAAHLPGSDGLIALLQQKGFSVTPVFSSKKIRPDNITYKALDPVWEQIEDAGKNYTVLMPGVPSEMTMHTIVKMKMYFDVFSSTLYMTTALKTPYSQAVADSIMDNMVKHFGAEKKDEKPVVINNIQGKEIQFNHDRYTHGYCFFDNGTMYLALGMSIKKDSLSTVMINKFLKSFSVLAKKEDDSKSFIYADSAMAYSIALPSKPETYNDDKNILTDSTVTRRLNISLDQQTGTYFFFGANQAAKGYIIPNDSLNFASIIDKQLNKLARVDVDTIFKKDNSSIAVMKGLMASPPLMMEVHYQSRGNRWYALVALYDSSKPGLSVDRFFRSFSLLNYPDHQWNTFSSDDKLFTTWAPDEFITKKQTADSNFSYETFDTSRGDNFEIVKQSFEKYYWQTSDSVLWSRVLKNASIAAADTLLSSKEISNAGLKGYELILQKQGSTSIKRKRIFLNGEYLYSVLTSQAASEIFNRNNNKFFEDFHFAKVEPYDALLVSKAEKVIGDLINEDSLTRADAAAFITDAPFQKTDLPLLQNALLQKYIPAESNDIKRKLTNSIAKLKDSSSYNFAKEKYWVSDEETKYYLLTLMASFPTTEHYSDIKNILLQGKLRLSDDYEFYNKFMDSPKLVKTVYTEMLPLFKDTELSSFIMRITKFFLDSNSINAALLYPYEKDITAISKIQIKVLDNNPDNYMYPDYALIDVLGKMNDPATNRALNEWSMQKDRFYKNKAVDFLLRNSQNVNPLAIQNLAADKEYRIEIYDSLKAYKKQILYPQKFLTQKSFAESYIYNAAVDDDDDEIPTLLYLTQKIINFKGKQSRFFFYKISYTEDQNAESLLACAGPFNTNANDLLEKDADGFIYTEAFDATDLKSQITALIKQAANDLILSEKK